MLYKHNIDMNVELCEELYDSDSIQSYNKYLCKAGYTHSAGKKNRKDNSELSSKVT